MSQPTSEEISNILKKRYFLPNENWEGLCHRVSNALGATEEEKQNFFEIMHECLFLPNSPALMNAGKPKKHQMMSACFALPVGDSIIEIFDAIKNTARIHQFGGGTGFNFSSLRPEGEKVRGSDGISSGPISFMKIFDMATQQMKAGGVRRGANLGCLNIDHPSIVKFIKCKNVDKEISNFNLSVMMSDDFMYHITTYPDRIWKCKFGEKHYILRKSKEPKQDGYWRYIEDTKDDEEYYTVQDLWDLICHQSWLNGEPGVIFIDQIHRKNSEDIQCVNPCGELPLRDYESCCLGSIDVSKFLDDIPVYYINKVEFHYELDNKKSLRWPIDLAALTDVVTVAVTFLNRILDCNTYPLAEIETASKKSRKIGLGIMGWADLLIKLKIRYGSDESFELADELMHFINTVGRNYSDLMKFNNETITSIAPCGTISLIAGSSSGIEPNFAFITKHHRPGLGDWEIVHPLLKEYNILNGVGIKNSKVIPGELPDYFITAQEVKPEEHIQMQSVFQANVDNAISKTINLPKDAKVEVVSDCILQAWNGGCKGLTLYRDGSRQDQVLTDATKLVKPVIKTAEKECVKTFLKRPYCLDSKTFKIKLDLGKDKVENTYVTVSVVDNTPYEVFLHGNIRDASPIVRQYIDTTTRLISVSLRGQVSLLEIIKQLEKVPASHLFSIPYKIAQILKEFIPEDTTLSELCPECESPTIFTEGCVKCTDCGWTKCG